MTLNACQGAVDLGAATFALVAAHYFELSKIGSPVSGMNWQTSWKS